MKNNNKNLRYFREYLARKKRQKTSKKKETKTNLADCINWFWMNSDPVVIHDGPENDCLLCWKVKTHNRIS